MTELIPTILVQSKEEFEARVRKIESLAPMAQIDVIDGSWIPGETWADPDEISAIVTPLQYELHLMVAHPIEHLDAWTELPSLKRVFFHIETATQPKQVIEAIRFHGWEVGIVLNPETPVSAVHDFAPYVDEVMFMTVKPGKNGAAFEPEVLKKIEELSNESGHELIGVDGGVSESTLAQCIDAGAGRLRVGHALDSWATLVRIAEQA